MQKNLINYRYSLKRITQGNGKTLKISYKIWLDHHGKAFGDGPHELLRRVDKTKSLHQAANQMGMAYSKAWRLIRTLEHRLAFPLLERKVGGPFGGGSRITPKAKELMNVYGRFREEANDALEEIYQKHFGSTPHPIPLRPLRRSSLGYVGRAPRERGRVRGRKA